MLKKNVIEIIHRIKARRIELLICHKLKIMQSRQIVKLANFNSFEEEVMSIVLTKENFDTTIENSAKPVLVDFWATWCGPCKMLGPIIEEISVDYKDKAVVAKLNVDDEGEIAEKFGIMSIPSVLIFKNGQLVEKMIGFRKKEQIAAIIDKYL